MKEWRVSGGDGKAGSKDHSAQAEDIFKRKETEKKCKRGGRWEKGWKREGRWEAEEDEDAAITKGLWALVTGLGDFLLAGCFQSLWVNRSLGCLLPPGLQWPSHIWNHWIQSYPVDESVGLGSSRPGAPPRFLTPPDCHRWTMIWVSVLVSETKRPQNSSALVIYCLKVAKI